MKAKRIVMAVTVLVLVLAMACALVSCDFGNKQHNVNLNSNDASFGSVHGDGEYKEGEHVTIIATEYDGYIFAGWYDGDTLISTDSFYSFVMGDKDVAYTAKFDICSYAVELECDETHGSVTGGGNYEYGSSVTITATANTGYSFVGWYVGDILLTSDNAYSFVMRDRDASYTAKFDICSYAVELECDKAQGNVTGGGDYDYGSNVTITATAKTGYSFAGWYLGDELISDKAEYIITNIAQNVTYTAKFSANKYDVTVECNEAQGSVTGGGNYDYGSSVTIKATANTGYSFVGWFIGDRRVSTAIEYEFKFVSEGIKYTAKFEINKYRVTLNLDSAQGSVTGGGSYDYGSSVTIKATAKTGYSFVGWYDNDELVSDDAEYTITNFSQNVIYTAKFSVNKYTVTVKYNEAQGSVTGSGDYDYGSNVIITATAKTGYSFVGWYIGDKLVSTAIEYKFKMVSENVNYTAKFEINKYRVTLNFDSIRGSVTGGGSYDYGSSVTITATAKTGYSFVGWYWGNTLITDKAEHTITNLSQNIAYTARFNINKYAVTIGYNEAQGSVTGSGNYNYGSNVTIIATAKTGYSFVGWYEGETLISDKAEFTINKISQNVAYLAIFSVNTYTVNVECDETQGSVTGGGNYDYGSTVTIIATAKKGYVFVGWYNGWILVSDKDEYTFDMSTNVAYIAKFDIDPALEMFAFSFSDNGDIIVYGFKKEFKDTKEIIVPDIVTSIGERAFYNCSNLTSVTIGNSVISIGERAFYNCSSLTSVTIGNSVASIGSSAFYDCSNISEVKYNGSIEQWLAISGLNNLMGNYSNKKLYIGGSELTELVIPDSVTSIASSAFSGCSGLTSVTIGNSVTNIGSRAFSGCSSLTSVTIGNSVTNIGSYTFLGCSGLASITIPDSVTSIGERAFSGCSSLTSVTIPDSVTSIGWGAFRDCSSLTSITIPNSVTSIGNSAFDGCSSLTSVTIPDSVTSIGNYTFSDCSGLTSVTIPDSVTSIGSFAFLDCSSLTSVTIPDSVTSIGDHAFSDCRSLTSVTIGNSVTSIGERAFLDCSSLTSVTIGSGVTSIGERAFHGCSSLTSVTIPDSVTSIGWGAFSDCSSLTSVTIPDSVTRIGNDAFYNCSGLTSVTIGSSVTSIGSSAFAYCSGLTSITIPNSVTSIGQSAFAYCSGLTSVTIGSSVTSIDDGAFLNYAAFYGCINISEVKYNGTIEQWLNISELDSIMRHSSNKKLFIGGSELTELVIPDSVTSIGSSAFRGCSNLTSVTIPDSVTSIGENAFYNCYALAEVYNLSNLNITKGSRNNGNVAYYALNVYTTLSEPSKLTEKDGMILHTDGNNVTLVRYIGDATSVIIPDSVTSIGESAFENCDRLTSITIPDSVTSIGESAFNGCYTLAEVYNLSNLNIIEGSRNNGYVAYYARDVYNSLLELSKLTEKNGMILHTDGNNVTLVRYNGNATSLIIPDRVTSIGEYAFRGCSGLTSVTIPDSVTSIGNYAFYGCSSLTSVTIPNSVTSIGNYAFNRCSSLTSVTIPNSVTSIGEGAFAVCSSLTSVTIPNSVTSIGASAFKDCRRLTSVTIPDSVTSIGSSAFYGCSGLTSVTIPNSVTSIGSSAFRDCSSLTSITIPNSVTSIGDSAFNGCSSLTSITIPNSVTSIGDSAFNGCSSLTSITIPDSVTSIGSSAFYGCSGLTNVTIGNGVTSIGSGAFYNCRSLTSVTFENTTGWFVSPSRNATSGTNVSVTDSSQNAKYLTDTYELYYWKRK